MPTYTASVRRLTSMRAIAPAKTGQTGYLVALAVLALICVVLAVLLPTLAVIVLLISCFVVVPLVYLSRTSHAETAALLRQRWLARAAAFHLARVGRGRPKFIDTSVTPDTVGNLYGSGMAIIRSRLFMMDRGHTAEIPWGAVRGWAAGGGDVVVVASTTDDSTLDVLPATTGGGVTLYVRDINKPIWHFETGNPAVVARWREILTRIEEADMREVAARR